MHLHYFFFSALSPDMALKEFYLWFDYSTNATNKCIPSINSKVGGRILPEMHHFLSIISLLVKKLVRPKAAYSDEWVADLK